MWLLPIVPALVWAVSAGAAPASASLELMPEAVVTRQTVFTIPFRIDQPNDPGKEPAEVQLYTSTDRGQNWRLYSKVAPSQNYFLFRAMGDGEFWFSVRTVDRFGTIRPEISRPELRVVVDTVPPRLEVRARRGSSGQITTQWEARDSRLRPDNVSIQYRLSADQSWQAVAINQQHYRLQDQTQFGEVSWWPNATSGTAQIRVEVADAAGNPSVYHAQVHLDAVDDRDSTASVQPEKNGVRDTGRTPLATGESNDPWRAAGSRSPAAAATGSAVAPPQASRPPATSDPTASRRVATPVAESKPAATTPPSAGSAKPGASFDAVQQSIPPRPSGSPVAANFNPPIRNQYQPSSDLRSGPVSAIPQGIQPQMINVKKFELDYDASTVGPWGVGRVELWGTTDGGRSWKSIAVDEDKQSPIRVSLSEEGLYGFRIAVQSSAGLGGDAPRSGDPVQLWVGADWTKPQGRITESRQGLGEAAAQLSIEWEASDTLLAERPVSLFYASNAGGPWTPIAKGLPASGRHLWYIDNRLHDRVYLRIEALDAAGNLGSQDLPEPIILQRFVPAVQIRDLRPLSAKGERS